MSEVLPTHPRTGLRAVGIVGGRPVWPILGGSGETTPPAVPAGQPTEPPKPAPPKAADPATPPVTPPAGDPPKADEPLGEGGLAALKAERDARKELEKQLTALAPLQKIAEALGGGDASKGKTELEQITERLGGYEAELKTERSARWRAELANQHSFTAEQAAELRGDTRDELAAHAERLKVLFPTAPAAPGTPKPDPSQGGQGGAGANLDSQIAEAQGKGDWRTALKLQNQKLAKATP